MDVECPANSVPVGIRKTGVAKRPEKAVLDKTFKNHRFPQLNEHNPVWL
jgi:hypothetical protein